MKFTLKTKRLGFRLLNENDIIYLEKLESDAEVRKFFPTGAHQNRQETESMVNKYLLNYEEKKLPCFILFDLESKEFVGRCGFSFYEAGELEVNYIFHKKFWGRGYASEALSALIAWAKKSINVNYIIGYAPLSHHASIRVMEKCGMEYYKNDIDPIDNIECCFYRINNQ